MRVPREDFARSEKIMQQVSGFGEFEIAPKKGFVSLRRKKQFAMLGPATNTRFELGLNIKSPRQLGTWS
jgi:hypothetical protein